MSTPSKPNEFETYAKHVESGLGFPNGRDSVSPEPTGWFGLESNGVVNVSRETSDVVDATSESGKQAAK